MEICSNGVWGSVCDSGWGYFDAAIVCLQMGFQGASMFYRAPVIINYSYSWLTTYLYACRVDATATTNSFFGDGAGPYHLSSVSCSGEERTLLDCSYTNQSIISLSSRCSSGNDAGVRCDGKVIIVTCSQLIKPFFIASVCSHGETRLFGGYTSNGNVGVAEVCINGKWADICDDVNRENVSRTFCRQLVGQQSCMCL